MLAGAEADGLKRPRTEGSGIGLKAFIFIGLLALAACTTVADVITQASGGFHVGESRGTPGGGYQTLRSGFEGWTIWEMATGDQLTCYAVKAGGGRLSPVPSPVLGIVSGSGGGFYMRAKRGPDGAPEAIFAGLYGTNAFVKQSRTEVGGEIYEALTPELAVQWEGQFGSYQVTTSPNFTSTGSLRRDIGALDFTGVGRAVRELGACADGRTAV